MKKVIRYFKARSKAWDEYYHLNAMSDRLLEDMGIDRKEIDNILK